MAKVLERAQALYDEDLLAWAERQVAHLRAGQLDRLDVEHLIEELDALAGRLRRELKNRLRILLAHLLKWQAQPKRRSRSWALPSPSSATRSRRCWRIEPPAVPGRDCARAYPRAVRLAAIETGLPRHAFRPSCPARGADLGDNLQSRELIITGWGEGA